MGIKCFVEDARRRVKSKANGGVDLRSIVQQFPLQRQSDQNLNF